MRNMINSALYNWNLKNIKKISSLISPRVTKGIQHITLHLSITSTFLGKGDQILKKKIYIYFLLFSLDENTYKIESK